MRLIKLKTPSDAILSIEISNFDTAKIVEKGILEVIFKDEKDNFLIKGNKLELETLFDELLSQKNHYTEQFLYKEEKDMFYDKLVVKF